MTVPPASILLNVDADLRVEVGGRSAALTGSGSRLVLKTDAPQTLLQSLRHVALPNAAGGLRGLGKVADLLSVHGLELHVEGPSGEIARLGAGAHSRLGRVFVGSGSVQVGSLRALGPLVGGLVPSRKLAGLTASAVGLIAIAVRIASRRKA